MRAPRVMQPEPTERYEILSSLATGGMAEVFLARVQGAAGFSKLIALKRIHAELADDSSFVERFIDEARIAARLNHPNIVQIFDLGIADGSYFIAMEYVHGKTVWDLCREAARRKLIVPLDVTLGILVAACEGLGFAHDQPGDDGAPLSIVHRDVSPQNLLLSFDGAVKVADFGIARVSGSVHKTEVGAVVGKLSYMSPEQMLAGEVDVRTDVYALGVVLHELLTGRKLWSTEELDPARRKNPPLPSSLNPALPTELDAIALRALAHEASDRYPSCDAMREELESVMAKNGIVNSARRRAELVQSWFADSRALPAEPQSAPKIGAPLKARPTIQLERSVIEKKAIVPSDGSISPRDTRLGETPTRISLAPVSPQDAVGPQPPIAPALAPRMIARPGVSGETSYAGVALPPPTPESTERSRAAQLGVIAVSAMLLVTAGLYAIFRGSVEGPQPRISPPIVSAPPTVDPALVDPPPVAPAKLAPPVAKPPIAAPAEPKHVQRPTADADLDPRAGKRHSEPVHASPKREKGALSLTTTPPVQVFLGKTSLGKTPLREAALPTGRSKLRLVAKESGIDLPLEVEVAAGETVTKSVTIGKGRLRIKAVPWAAVTVDGNDLGTTPLPPQALYAGTHTVVLTYKPEGGVPKQKREQLTLKEGEDRLLEADLR